MAQRDSDLWIVAEDPKFSITDAYRILNGEDPRTVLSMTPDDTAEIVPNEHRGASADDIVLTDGQARLLLAGVRPLSPLTAAGQQHWKRQIRAPKGTPIGGQWVDELGGVIRWSWKPSGKKIKPTTVVYKKDGDDGDVVAIRKDGNAVARRRGAGFVVQTKQSDGSWKDDGSTLKKKAAYDRLRGQSGEEWETPDVTPLSENDDDTVGLVESQQVEDVSETSDVPTTSNVPRDTQTDRQVTSPQVSTPQVSTPENRTPITPTKAVYRKDIPDGEVIAQSGDDTERVRWDASRKKFAVEQNTGDGDWRETSTLNKKQTYDRLKNGEWFEVSVESTSDVTDTTSNVPNVGDTVDTDDRASSIVTPSDAATIQKATPLNLKNATPEAAQALDNYITYGIGLNRYIRDNGSNDANMPAIYQDEIRQLDAALDKSRTTSEIRTLRGIRKPADVFGSSWPGDGDPTGLTWTDAAYTSTTYSDEVAADFAGTPGVDKDRALILNITVPPGVGAADLTHELESDNEAEVLLERGLTYRVTSDRGFNENGVRVWDVEVVTAASVNSPTTDDATSTEDINTQLESTRSEIETLSERMRPLKETMDANTGGSGSYTAYQNARREYEELRDLAHAASQVELDLLARRDGAPWDVSPSEMDQSRWENRPEATVSVKPGVDSVALTKIRDMYVVKDEQTLKQNASLRSGDPTASAKTWRSKVRKLVDSGSVTSDAVVHRGAALPPEMVMDLRPGSVITDSGVMSTDTRPGASADMYVSERMRTQPHAVKVMFDIRVPAGTPAASVGYGELVLGDNTSMRVVSTQRDSDGTVRVTTEIVPRGEDTTQGETPSTSVSTSESAEDWWNTPQAEAKRDEFREEFDREPVEPGTTGAPPASRPAPFTGERLSPEDDFPAANSNARFSGTAENVLVPLLVSGYTLPQAQRVQELNQKLAERYGVSFNTAMSMDTYRQTDPNAPEGAVAAVTTGPDGRSLLVVQGGTTDDLLQHSHDHGEIAVGNLEGLVTHEVAHALFQHENSGQIYPPARAASRTRVSDALADAYEAALDAGFNPAQDVVSSYSTTNEREWQAELFAAYHWGGESRPAWLTAWGEALHRSLGLDPTPLQES